MRAKIILTIADLERKINAFKPPPSSQWIWGGGSVVDTLAVVVVVFPS